ncbi:hypothetical protein FD755_011406, partial [Muntiacus reevesi]
VSSFVLFLFSFHIQGMSYDWLCQFTFPPTVQEGFLLSTPSPAFVICGIFGDSHSDQCEVICHCLFDLNFCNNWRFCTFAQSCPTLCNSIDGKHCSGLPLPSPMHACMLSASVVSVSILCSTPGNIKNGRFTIYKDEYQYNEIVTYMCDPSNGPDEYSLVGESRLVCVDRDRWSSEPPECKVVKCDYPVVEHGMIVSGFRRKFYYKAQVVFKCNQGFSLHGSSTIVCNANSTWEPQIPTCAQAFNYPCFLTGIMDQVWKIYVFFI